MIYMSVSAVFREMVSSLLCFMAFICVSIYLCKSVTLMRLFLDPTSGFFQCLSLAVPVIFNLGLVF